MRGKTYKLSFERLKDKYGSCDHPETKDKTIRIDQRLRGEKLVEIILHELIHAGCWDLSEETVTEIAKDGARILKRLGLIDAG